MNLPRVILDANVVVASLRSRRGASFQVISLLGAGRFEIALSVPLAVEYEASAKKTARGCGLRHEDVEAVIDYLCLEAIHQDVHFLWRPYLPDAGDDMVLELAVAADADAIVTFNLRDFNGCERFGVRAVTPQQFLHELQSIP